MRRGKTMVCDKCGNKIAKGTMFCGNCGNKIEVMPETEIKKKKSILPFIVVGILLVIGIIAIVVMTVKSNPDRKYEKQLKIAQRYVDELDYEKAIAAYKAAIEIDPKRPEAYLELAEVYEENGNYDEAVRILKEGYDKTGDEEIKDMLERLEKKLLTSDNDVQNENEEADNSVEAVSREEQIEKFIEKYEPLMEKIAIEYEAFEGEGNEIGWYCAPQDYYSKYHSDEMLKEIYNPLITELEEYKKEIAELNFEGEEEIDGRIYKGQEELESYCQKYCKKSGQVFLTEDIAELFLYQYYLWVGDMEKRAALAPKLIGCPYIYSGEEGTTYDQYGREIHAVYRDGSVTDYTYDGNRLIHQRSDSSQYVDMTMEYDAKGRMTVFIQDYNGDTTTYYYEYTDDHNIVEKWEDHESGITIDEYGGVHFE